MARYTAVQDRTSITLPLVKSHLRLDGDTEDVIVTLYLGAACQKADTYLQNPFLDYDNITPLDIPLDVDLWVLQVVAKFYYHRTLGVHKEDVTDLGSIQYEKLDNVDVNYEGLKPYRRTKGFGGF